MSATFWSASCPPAASLGSLMWTEARMVVPRLVGQKVRKPRRLSWAKGRRFSISLAPAIRRPKISPTLPPWRKSYNGVSKVVYNKSKLFGLKPVSYYEHIFPCKLSSENSPYKVYKSRRESAIASAERFCTAAKSSLTTKNFWQKVDSERKSRKSF